MKKICIIFLSALIIFSFTSSLCLASGLWEGDVATQFGGGSGTKESPYLIKTPSQLALLSERVQGGEDFKNTYFSLENDLLLNNILQGEEIESPKEWTPIGNPITHFQGIFMGNYHTIRGIYMKTASDFTGLFGVLGEDSIVTSLRIENCSIEGLNYVGSIAGENNGTIFGCGNFGISVRGEKYIGGIVGKNNNTVSNCENHCWVGRNEFSGGIAGENNGKIKNCYNSGTVDGGYSFAGGIAGENKGEISCCYNVGWIISEFGLWGSIIGSPNGGSVEFCYYRSGLEEETIGTPLSESEIFSSESYKGFDFSSVWEMPKTEEYPYPILKQTDYVFKTISEATSEDVMSDSTSQTTSNENHASLKIAVAISAGVILLISLILAIKRKKQQ